MKVLDRDQLIHEDVYSYPWHLMSDKEALAFAFYLITQRTSCLGSAARDKYHNQFHKAPPYLLDIWAEKAVTLLDIKTNKSLKNKLSDASREIESLKAHNKRLMDLINLKVTKEYLR